MPRPKGSKNKTKDTNIDYASAIAEKESEKAGVNSEIENLVGVIAESKEELKAKRKQLKSIDKKIEFLKTAKEAADKYAAEQARNNEAVEIVKQALDQGMTVDDILGLLK